MKKPQGLGFLAIFAALMFSVSAQAAIIYAVDGDSDIGWIIDTDAETFTSFDTSAVDLGYNIAVRDTIVLGARDDNGSVEYDLSGVATGNTWSGGDNFSELLDGTTNGVSANYGIECCGETNSVTVADLTWENQQVLFDLPSSNEGYSGIAFDTASQTLWIVGYEDDQITNYTLGGGVIDSFAHGLDEFDPCCLAYDESDDTLWLGRNGSNELRQFSKAGALLDTVTIPGWSPSNQWGAEIAISGVAPVTTPVPTMHAAGLGLMILLMVALGMVFVRRF